MQTTTIRVDVETHRQLVALSERHGQSLGATVRLAAEALNRNDLTIRINSQLDRLHDDPNEWGNYLAENEMFGASEGLVESNRVRGAGGVGR